MDDLTTDDYRVILQRQASDVFGSAQVESLLKVTQEASNLVKSKNCDATAVNMRDLARFLTLYRRFTSQGDNHEVAIASSLRICYFPDLKIAYDHGLLTQAIEIPLATITRAKDN